MFDDWFATVGSAPEDLPNFMSSEWQQLFGDSNYQFMDGDNDVEQDQPPPEPMATRVQARRAMVGGALDTRSQPLPMDPQHGFDEHPAEEREKAWTQPKQPKPVHVKTRDSVARLKGVAPELKDPPRHTSPSTPPQPSTAPDPIHVEVVNDVEGPPTPASKPVPTPKRTRLIQELATMGLAGQNLMDL